MKNLSQILSAILILCLVTDIANSQTLKVTGGVNLMSIDTALESSNDGDPNDDPSDDPADLPARASIINGKTSNNQASFVSKNGTTNETGFYLGLALSDISLFNNFELQPEVRFVAVKDFNQIQLPVLLSYNVIEELRVLAGPNFAFLLDAGDGVKSFNFAADFGLSYNVTDKISLDARYDMGLTNLLEDGDSDNYIKINNIQLGVVYRFGK